MSVGRSAETRLQANVRGSLLTDDGEPFAFTNSLNHTFSYDFVANRMTVGQKIVKVNLDQQEISESPFRIAVIPRDCAAEVGSTQVPDALWNCVCEDGRVEIGDRYVALSILLPSLVVPVILVLLICAMSRESNANPICCGSLIPMSFALMRILVSWGEGALERYGWPIIVGLRLR